MLIWGWLLKEASPSATISFVDGGRWGLPFTLIQLVGFSQALLT